MTGPTSDHTEFDHTEFDRTEFERTEPDRRDVIDELSLAAVASRPSAYVPYTDFDAAAAVRWEAVEGDHTGQSLGVVVENVSLGLAMCAERNALFAAIAAGGRPTHLVLAAPSTRDGLTMPCGACLQVALELGGPDLIVASVPTDGGEPTVTTVHALLPSAPYTGPH